VLPLAILVVAAAWHYFGSGSDTVYVVYHGESYPATEAGRHVCHDLAAPQIRCFDTVEELIRDLEATSPRHAESFKRLWLATWPPSMTPERSP
jgi:hypothetical protein